jgi:signal transduction histidine kinase
MIKRPFLIGCFLLTLAVAAAQTDIRQLEQSLLDQSLPDTQRIDILNELGRELSFLQPARANTYIHQALELSNEMNYPRGAANAYRMLASMYTQEDNSYLSAEYLKRALDYFFSSGDSLGIANCYITLGHAFRRQGNRTEEIRYHRMAFEMARRSGVKERIGVTSHNLGESYYNNGEDAKADSLTRYSIQINNEVGNKPVLSSCYKVLGLLAVRRHQWTEAETHFQQVLDYTRELGLYSQKIATVEALIQMAGIRSHQGNVNEQLQYLKAAADTAKSSKLLAQVQRIYADIIQVYATKDPAQVHRYLEEFTITNDSLMRQQQRDRMILMKNAIEGFRLEDERKQLLEKTSQQEASLAYRNRLLIVSAVATALLIGLIFLLKRANSRTRATNKMLVAQGDEIALQKQELEKANLTKDKFFSIIAHDLRSPLSSLKAYSMLIVNHINDLTKEELRTMGEQLAGSVDNTLRLTDNLITWARLQRGEIQVNKVPVSIKPVVDEVVFLFHGVAKEKKISLETHIPVDLEAMGDTDHINFIIRNLVNNALKFTGQDGKIEVTASRSGKWIDVSVKDSGVGMSQKTLDSIFQVGHRSSEGTRGEKGTGLGLPMCKEFAVKMEGDLLASSKQGEGSVFILRLPASAYHSTASR